MEERLILERVLDEARTEKQLSRTNWERLRTIFRDRFDRAWRLVQEQRVKRYTFHPSGRVVWVVVGQGGEYQVYPEAGYCGCDDFSSALSTEKPVYVITYSDRNSPKP